MDPLQNIYIKLITEGYDHRSLELDNKDIPTNHFEYYEGMHIAMIDEISLTNGISTPVDVEFEAEFIEPEDHERHYGADAGWNCTPIKFTISKGITSNDIGEMVTGTDVTEFVTKEEYVRIANILDNMMNKRLQEFKVSHATDADDEF